MAVSPQTQTSNITEATASVATGSTSANVDMMQLYSTLISQYVARQVVTVGDPISPTGVLNVGATLPSGSESAAMVRQSPGGQEIQMVIQELRNLRAEVQTMVVALGGLPVTAIPLQETLINAGAN